MNGRQKQELAGILERHGVVVGYLFGSAARGNMGPHSDIDVAVLFDERLSLEDQSNKKMDIINDATRALGIERVDVINLMTTTDPLIKYVAVFSGELIFEKNKDKRFFVERKTVREYENTRELRRIARMVMKRQLADGSFGKAVKTV
jgi:predicted nucleotidyltransferase